MSHIQKTYSMKASEIQNKWFIVDAEGKVLGRIASEIAKILRGKHKPEYTPHLEMGDSVIVINADKVVLTGSKSTDKDYFSHSNYPGGINFVNIRKAQKTRPDFVIRHAVKGMLPHNRLSNKLITNLKIYTGPEHPHAAQQPVALEL
jgi:large subunit ribosomal protein L13